VNQRLKLVPWVVAAVALAGAALAARPSPNVRGFDLDGFGRLPVLEGGRVKPIDSVARNSLLVIRSQQSFRHEGRTIGASEWLLDVLFRPQVASAQPVFNVDDPDILGFLGRQQTKNRYLSFQDLAPHLGEIQKQAGAAHQIDPKLRDRFQTAVVNLFDRVYLYYRLSNSAQLFGTAGLAAEVASRADANAAERQRSLAELAYFRPVPPAAGEPAEAWKNVGESLFATRAGPPSPYVEAMARLGVAYTAQDPASFNRVIGDLAALGAAGQPGVWEHAGHELVFNRAQPFYVGMVLYVLALLAVFVSWAWKPDAFRAAAFGFLVAAVLVHTLGLASRVVLQGRPPVTNLYSSAVFVGWGAVVLGVLLEKLYKRGFATAVAAVAGFASLLVAHHLSGDGDTMEMMRAVLDSNFWLATHVITITIGYSGMFLAGFLALGWVIRRHLVRRPDPGTSRTLLAATYGIVCFSLFFSFVGTVLGGIWADQSWGRFWGWDPKENGALLIVLWCAILLHARWAGYARERGIMTMAIFGNVITSLSWFGVNMLGVGLHSYGFMDSAFWALSGFIASQLLFMGLALLPPRFWARRAEEPDQASGGATGAAT
jgi:ABC-type transport system involved in cytochrome c biogenesis permease subunit